MKSGSNLERVLTSGNFAVTGELGPPKNSDPDVVRKKARLFKGNVDAVNITDCQTAVVRMSSIGAGLLTQSEGVEPVIQMTCRDRNRIGMQRSFKRATENVYGSCNHGMSQITCLTAGQPVSASRAALGRAGSPCRPRRAEDSDGSRAGSTPYLSAFHTRARQHRRCPQEDPDPHSSPRTGCATGIGRVRPTG